MYGILILDFVGIFLALLFSSTLLMDNLEHIRMSYLVSQGFVPYRDFFEHHHPLLWYIFSPFMKILPHNIISVLWFSRFIALISRIIMLYFIYLIFKRFFGDDKLMPYFLLLLLSFYPIWYGFSYFKPDTFEQMFYFGGLYYFIKYIYINKRTDLVISAIFFSVSFLFLQTIIFSILPLLLPLIYTADKNHKVIKDALIALILPLLLFISIMFCMYKNGILGRYYELNWIFNRHVFTLSDDIIDFSSAITYYIIQLFIGIGAFIWLIKKEKDNKCIKIIGLLFVFSIFEHTIFIATNAHYLIITLIYCSMLVAPLLKYIFSGAQKQSRGMILFYGLAYFIVYLLLNYTCVWLYNNADLFTVQKIVADNDDKEVVNVDNTYKFIWSKHISYYEMRNTLHKIDNYLFHSNIQYDVNKEIMLHKPKYLEYDEKLALKSHKYKIKNNRFKISPEVIRDYIQIYPNLWQRRDTLSQ